MTYFDEIIRINNEIIQKRIIWYFMNIRGKFVVYDSQQIPISRPLISDEGSILRRLAIKNTIISVNASFLRQCTVCRLVNTKMNLRKKR